MPDEQTTPSAEPTLPPPVAPEPAPEAPEATATGTDDLRGAAVPTSERASLEAQGFLAQIRARQAGNEPEAPEAPETPAPEAPETPTDPAAAAGTEAPETPAAEPETPADPAAAAGTEAPETPAAEPEPMGHDAVIARHQAQIGNRDPVEFHEQLHQHIASLESNPAETIQVLVRQYETRNPEMRAIAARLRGDGAPAPAGQQAQPVQPAAPAELTLDIPDSDLDSPEDKSMKAEMRKFAKAANERITGLTQDLQTAQALSHQTDINARAAVVQQQATTTIDAFRSTLPDADRAMFDDQDVANQIGVLTKDDPRFNGANFTTEHLAEVFDAATLALPKTRSAAILRIAGRNAAPAAPAAKPTKPAAKAPITAAPSPSSQPGASAPHAP